MRPRAFSVQSHGSQIEIEFASDVSDNVDRIWRISKVQSSASNASLSTLLEELDDVFRESVPNTEEGDIMSEKSETADSRAEERKALHESPLEKRSLSQFEEKEQEHLQQRQQEILTDEQHQSVQGTSCENGTGAASIQRKPYGNGESKAFVVNGQEDVKFSSSGLQPNVLMKDDHEDARAVAKSDEEDAGKSTPSNEHPHTGEVSDVSTSKTSGRVVPSHIAPSISIMKHTLSPSSIVEHEISNGHTQEDEDRISILRELEELDMEIEQERLNFAEISCLSFTSPSSLEQKTANEANSKGESQDVDSVVYGDRRQDSSLSKTNVARNDRQNDLIAERKIIREYVTKKQDRSISNVNDQAIVERERTQRPGDERRDEIVEQEMEVVDTGLLAFDRQSPDKDSTDIVDSRTIAQEEMKQIDVITTTTTTKTATTVMNKKKIVRPRSAMQMRRASKEEQAVERVTYKTYKERRAPSPALRGRLKDRPNTASTGVYSRLYNDGMTLRQLRNSWAEDENKKREMEETKEMTFKPKISQASDMLLGTKKRPSSAKPWERLSRSKVVQPLTSTSRHQIRKQEYIAKKESEITFRPRVSENSQRLYLQQVKSGKRLPTEKFLQLDARKRKSVERRDNNNDMEKRKEDRNVKSMSSFEQAELYNRLTYTKLEKVLIEEPKYPFKPDIGDIPSRRPAGTSITNALHLEGQVSEARQRERQNQREEELARRKRHLTKNSRKLWKKMRREKMESLLKLLRRMRENGKWPNCKNEDIDRMHEMSQYREQTLESTKSALLLQIARVFEGNRISYIGMDQFMSILDSEFGVDRLSLHIRELDRAEKSKSEKEEPPFRPEINETSKRMRQKGVLAYETEMRRVILEREEWVKRQREEKERQEMEECTFKPDTTKSTRYASSRSSSPAMSFRKNNSRPGTLTNLTHRSQSSLSNTQSESAGSIYSDFSSSIQSIIHTVNESTKAYRERSHVPKISNSRGKALRPSTPDYRINTKRRSSSTCYSDLYKKSTASVGDKSVTNDT